MLTTEPWGVQRGPTEGIGRMTTQAEFAIERGAVLARLASVVSSTRGSRQGREVRGNLSNFRIREGARKWRHDG